MQPEPKRPLGLVDILLLPFGCLMQLPPLAVVIIGGGVLLVAAYFYYTTNSDFGGLARPAFENLEVSPDFGKVTSKTDQRSWKITYEQSTGSAFSGAVRHVSHWREEDIPFATHDVLITTQDFADPTRVDTNVTNHRFSYWSAEPAPQGNINLLHIVPLNEEIYRQLLELKVWDTVTIAGREIFKIDKFDAEGALLGWWQDAGCNTILVKSVRIGNS